MTIPDILAFEQWRYSVWVLLGIVAVFGLLAILSPRLFARLAAFSGVWIDTKRALSTLDRRVQIDRPILRYCRVFGVCVVAAAATMAILIAPMLAAGHWILWGSLGVAGALGLLATISPRFFTRLANTSSTWLDTDKVVDRLDQKVEIDRYILRHCRLFGLVSVAAAAVLALLVV